MIPTILFCEENSIYKSLKFGPSKTPCEVYDKKRNALTFAGGYAAIYHPPCRLWSRMRGLSTAEPAEKLLAIWAVGMVRMYGGILEHPADSTLWERMDLPDPGSIDSFGGFTIVVDQYHFGHKCRKRTWLYIVGIRPVDPVLHYRRIPGQPKFWLGHCKRPGQKKAIPKKDHSKTPKKFAKWLVKIVTKINNYEKRN